MAGEGDDLDSSWGDSLLRAVAHAPERSTDIVAPEKSLQAGELISDRFVLERLLGEGGMGVVWAARHVVTRKPVALKFMRTSKGRREEARRRFLREARAACAVRHPSIIEVHDVLELADGCLVMVMDLLEGETFAARLAREHALPLAEVARIMVAACLAVDAAHGAGIVHRDLKPENLFLAVHGDGSMVVKVLDFGIAKLRSSADRVDAATMTGNDTLLGTPLYMAPEQIFAEGDIDHRADLWAVGVILYEALAGVRPTDGANVGQVLKRITQERITPLRELVPNLPVAVLDLVEKLLQRDRNRRPSSLREVVDVLSTCTGPLVTAPPPTRSVRPGVNATITGGASSASPWFVARSGGLGGGERRTVARVTAGAMGLLAALALAFGLARSGAALRGVLASSKRVSHLLGVDGPKEPSLRVVASAPCRVGTCAEGVLVSGQRQPARIVESSGFLYWTNWGDSSSGSGTVMRLSLASGEVSEIASGQTLPSGIAVVGQTVYWTNNTIPGAIMSVSVNGGSPVPFASGQESPAELTVAHGDLFWTNQGRLNWNSGGVSRADLSSGAVTEIARGQIAWGIASDASNVYWTNDSAMTVLSAPIAGGMIATIASNQDYPIGITVEGETVYWANSVAGTVMSAPAKGGPATTLARGQGRPGLLRVGDGHLYWAAGEKPSMSLATMPVAGGSIATLASAKFLADLVVDGTSVYWLDALAGTVNRVAR